MRTKNKIKVGDKVKHPFAGKGIVKRMQGKTENGTAFVKYDNGSRGGARIGDLEKIKV